MKAGLIGNGIGPSLTPALHEAEGRALGLDYTYTRLDTALPPWNGMALSEILDHAQAEGFAGLNITHPHKTRVGAYLDELSGTSRALSTVNTVVFRSGRRIGHTTDYTGFRRALQESGLPVQGRQVVQFGAGGAGAATALALVDEGASVLLVDLSRERADETARMIELARPGAGVSAATAPLEDLGRFTGAVNATPIGMSDYPGMAFDPEKLPPLAWVIDVVYFPLETALTLEARRQGRAVVNGGAMALYQAVGAFELITGHTPDAERMKRCFEALIAERVEHGREGAT